MNATRYALLAATLAAALGGGYWLGGSQRTEDGRQKTEVQRSAPTQERKILYYRNPMGLADTSPVPKKDAMGMDYVPVYADAEEVAGQVAISAEKVQQLGVRTEMAAMRVLDRMVRATGRVEIDERRIHAIAPKFEGWVEKLHVNATGQAVAQGQPLFDAYSPELVSTQREYAIAVQGTQSLQSAGREAQAGMQQLAAASLTRLKNWDVSERQIQALAQSGGSQRTLAFLSPVSGVVLEKKALPGMRFMPGDMLYQIADLSRVWIIADVPEQEVAAVKQGNAAEVHVEGLPGRSFTGRVDFIYPTMNEMTRTVPVRIEIPNPDGALKPAMYAQATIASGAHGAVLALPLSAVIDSGVKQVVLVNKGGGRFAPREVKLGMKGGDYVEVIGGVTEGEEIVTAAQFLLDSESNLKAALGGMTEAGLDSSRQVGPTPDLQTKSVGHQARGVLEAVNEDGTVSITHEPIPSLKWAGMTMDFALANPALVANVKPGSAIEFELVERGEGAWVITRMTTRGKSRAEHRH